jgi:hypothetical protein
VVAADLLVDVLVMFLGYTVEEDDAEEEGGEEKDWGGCEEEGEEWVEEGVEESQEEEKAEEERVPVEEGAAGQQRLHLAVIHGRKLTSAANNSDESMLNERNEMISIETRLHTTACTN